MCTSVVQNDVLLASINILPGCPPGIIDDTIHGPQGLPLSGMAEVLDRTLRPIP